MRRYVLLAAVVLGLLHHDFWWWDDRTLVLGFLPIGLFYHMLFSLVVAALWIVAVKYAWPDDLEAWADETAAGPEQGGPRT